jgi:hypothetical protein
LRIRLEAVHNTLWETRFKIYLKEEVSRQHREQAAVWALLAAFTQIYSEFGKFATWTKKEAKEGCS